MTTAPPPPGWYPDQADQRYVRWWDGRQWTQHVQPAQPQAPQQPAPQQPGGNPRPYGGHPQQGHPQQGHPQQGYPQPVGHSDAEAIELNIDRGHNPADIQQQVAGATGGAATGGGGTLFTEPILVVNQKGKLIEMANEFQVFSQHGQQLGSVVQVGQSGMKKAVRLLTKYDQFMTHRFELRDIQHTPLLQLTRPAKVFKSKMLVSYPNGQQLGEIVQENVFGKIKFALNVNGQQIGSIQAENWRAWNFAILDAGENEIARITKTWAGLARAMFTTADNYVVQLHRPLADPLLSMVLAAALTVDTALKQDS
ncbi:phospholipid scramblase-related protein [Tamaricihabitans halophyticus]|uniref:phospholipid scramblase-related protein n=1 Tax=Tamaricihabitans halophyticus TaxID=1262583 RepID=UPI00140458C9|nr:phospholipid scramblase-related protein [Tamaricihabitans halophyticus]